jgi:Polyketide cyclase / dehydrase and lipid transport
VRLGPYFAGRSAIWDEVGGYVAEVARSGGWWLASSHHVVSDEVPAPAAEVRDFYCDLHNIERVHPLVVSVQTVGREETADSYTQTYRVHDRIPLGRFTMAISYVARVHVPTHGDVFTEARQFPQVRLHGKVSFEPIGGGTRLTERLRIEAPRPLATTTARQAVKAHEAMLAGIRRCFE